MDGAVTARSAGDAVREEQFEQVVSKEKNSALVMQCGRKCSNW
jgi:hypothetical protein